MKHAPNFDLYRRRAERKAYNAEVSFSADSMCFPGILENVSRGGARVCTKSLPIMNAGKTITITIPFALKQGSVKRRASIMWAAEGQFGIMFK